MSSQDPLARYFAGEALYGDDFGPQELAKWYAGEREGYAGEVKTRAETYRYKYHAINRHYGFRHLPERPNLRVLGIGSAYGDELSPLAPRAASFDIVEPSDEFSENRTINGVPAIYHRPREDGLFDFEDERFDLVTAFSVLHHIANVSTVVGEIHRILKPGGIFLAREPIVSMGDWRRRRGNLTINERGIPHRIFLGILRDAGFEVRKAALFDFAPFVRVIDNMGLDCFGNMALTRIDRALSLLFSFNRKYHRPRLLEKFGPASMFVVAEKRAG